MVRTFEPSYTKDGQDYPLNPRFEIYSGNLKKVGDYTDFDVKLVQVEQKQSPTSYTDSVRGGIIKDYSFNKNHANLDLVSTPKWRSNKNNENGFYEFDGVGDYISLGSVSDSIIRKGMEANDFTMSAWIKIPSNITKTGIILATSGNHAGLNVLPTRDIRFSLWDEKSQSNNIISKKLTANEWHYVVGVYSNKTMYLYVDGKLEGTNNYFSSNPTVKFKENIANLFVGGTMDSTLYDFNGSIDDVRIYTRALSSSEIKSNYNISKYKIN